MNYTKTILTVHIAVILALGFMMHREVYKKEKQIKDTTNEQFKRKENKTN